MIVNLEVSSAKKYERLYSRPIWPKGESGVTIGIGYDLRFSNKTLLHRDWSNLIGASDLEKLEPVLRLGGTEARDAIPSVSSITIAWDAAYRQFLGFLPYPTAETEDIFPNHDQLSDHSFGALVSLVYNRGAAIPRNSARRREMYEIHLLMKSGDFSPIPDKIRSMKRLWTTQESRGLVIRRELEAQLFEFGRKSN